MNADVFEKLLKETNYDPVETEFLVKGFRQGFDIGYRGPERRRSKSKNIPLTVGSKTELWNKIMKEVKLGRVAGPFEEVPYQFFIQSPIGLVPKAGDAQTRLIFHLSYDFNGDQEEEKSVNHHTPKELCTVKYRDLDHAVNNYLQLKSIGEANQSRVSGYRPIVYGGKSDIKSAFRVAPLLRKCWPWLIMLAYHPITNQAQYFVDKCLPFGASISCAIFQRISNGLKHIMEVRHKITLTNYLDDFLFLALTILHCNYLVSQFLVLCQEIGFPIAQEKTEWACELITFLGVLLNGKLYMLSVPLEKKIKAENMLRSMLSHTKTTVKDLQILCG